MRRQTWLREKEEVQGSTHPCARSKGKASSACMGLPLNGEAATSPKATLGPNDQNRNRLRHPEWTDYPAGAKESARAIAQASRKRTSSVPSVSSPGRSAG